MKSIYFNIFDYYSLENLLWIDDRNEQKNKVIFTVDHNYSTSILLKKIILVFCNLEAFSEILYHRLQKESKMLSNSHSPGF